MRPSLSLCKKTAEIFLCGFLRGVWRPERGPCGDGLSTTAGSEEEKYAFFR